MPANVVLDNAANYTEFKGSIAENAILQALISSSHTVPYYWSNNNRAEIVFVMQAHDKVVPIEVKAENCVSGRSLTVYNEKYHPELRIRFSFLNLQYRDGLLACPAPLAEWYTKWL